MTTYNHPAAVLVSVGGAPAPVLHVLQQHRPAHVWYFCSAGSRATADEIHRQLDWHPAPRFIEVARFEELGPCYRELRRKIPDILAETRLSPEQVLVDYTCGTKTMSAALVLAAVLAALRASGHPFCLTAGLAVNHDLEPVVTLDADFTITSAAGVAEALRAVGFSVESHPHSLNATLPGSRLRIRTAANDRYAPFPSLAVQGELFGVSHLIAGLEDLVQGKLWAATDPTRRASKHAKDEADRVRICESHPAMLPLIPPGLFARIDQLRNPN